MMTQRSTMSWRMLITTMLTVFFLPDRVQAGSLRDLFQPALTAKGDEGITLESREATDFLRTSPTRVRRHVKWYQQNPDFQSWYKYYQKIGHTEGLYEIDRIRLIYAQMRHLENVYGKDASYYQYSIGLAPTLGSVKGVSVPVCDPKKDRTCKPQPPAPKAPVVQLPAAPVKAQYQTQSQLSCNPHDPACLLQYFYAFLGNIQKDSACDPKTDPKCSRGARACDPKYDSACTPSKPAARPYKHPEYACNPTYDPDCNDEDDYRGSQRPDHGPTDFEGEEDEEEEEEDDEMDPYDPKYPGYYGYPSSYYDRYNPYGQLPYGNPYTASPYASPRNSPYGNPHNSPYNNPHETPYNPHETPYNNPHETPYNNPHETPYNPHETPYNNPHEYPYNNPPESPYNSQYPSPYNSQYPSPYNSQYPSPYAPQYGHEDEHEDEAEEDDEY